MQEMIQTVSECSQGNEVERMGAAIIRESVRLQGRGGCLTLRQRVG